MAQTFFINKDSELPRLRMAVVNDGDFSYHKYFYAIQANDGVTFSMRNAETGIYKVANAEAKVVYDEDSSCEERYLLEYAWKKRDTNEPGTYIGTFRIKMSGKPKMEGYTFPEGDLIVPIQNDLVIVVNDSTMKR